MVSGYYFRSSRDAASELNERPRYNNAGVYNYKAAIGSNKRLVIQVYPDYEPKSRPVGLDDSDLVCIVSNFPQNLGWTPNIPEQEEEFLRRVGHCLAESEEALTPKGAARIEFGHKKKEGDGPWRSYNFTVSLFPGIKAWFDRFTFESKCTEELSETLVDRRSEKDSISCHPEIKFQHGKFSG